MNSQNRDLRFILGRSLASLFSPRNQSDYTKTQSALLEAMEEKQVTVEGETRALPQPFFVIATQNPVTLSGTFPLPESQLDRFLMRLHLGYPNEQAERELLLRESEDQEVSAISRCLSGDDIAEIQRLSANVFTSDSCWTTCRG